jgi:cyclic-di-AMP phosphodiesterase PgpH
MATLGKSAKRDRPVRRWFLSAANNLRSDLGWRDLLAALVAALAISAVVSTSWRQVPGTVFFVVTMEYALWRYLVYYRTDEERFRETWLLAESTVVLTLVFIRSLAWLTAVVYGRMGVTELSASFQSGYFLPYGLGAVLITLLVDVNIAILGAVVVSVLCGLFHGDIFSAAYALTANLAGIYSIRQYRDRAAVLKAGLTIGLVSVPAALSADMLRGAAGMPTLSGGVVAAAAGGLLTASLVSVLLPAFEWVFRITTDLRMLELSNLNSPLLRELSVEAPGTYHHSLMVGTLGEAAAEAIGANPLLVRVGAYYHDIGKMLKPEYFVENQSFGMNKHEALAPSMSCLVISSHVKEGLELARRYGVPRQISDMIPQHHGTRVMGYFYQKALGASDSNGSDVLESDFRYPGPKPQTREAAIIMMADAVEAASRTLTAPSAAQLQGMIDRLVREVAADDQLDECGMTFKDVRRVKESFLRVLTSLHHRRIHYPGYDFRDNSEQPERTTAPGNGAKQAKDI